jgi:hypothetical protein
LKFGFLEVVFLRALPRKSSTSLLNLVFLRFCFFISARPRALEVQRTMSRSQTRRKCRCCSKFFMPEPQTEDRQRYCSRTACRQAGAFPDV